MSGRDCKADDPVRRCDCNYNQGTCHCSDSDCDWEPEPVFCVCGTNVSCACRKHARCSSCMQRDGLASKSPSHAARIIHVLSDRANRDPRFLRSVVEKVRR